MTNGLAYNYRAAMCQVNIFCERKFKKQFKKIKTNRILGNLVINIIHDQFFILKKLLYIYSNYLIQRKLILITNHPASSTLLTNETDPVL